MWSPTHVQVTVQKAKGLLIKGKHGTNDCFVIIGLGKEKYQTSVKQKAVEDVDFHEECELAIPTKGNKAEVVLTALHRNFMGVDEFLGTVSIPLSDFDVYERPRNRWYQLKSKPGKEKNKPRGELEVKIAFTVKAGSLTDLSKKEKHKSSLGQLSVMAQSVGGSLLSIGSMEKRGLKKLAKSIGNKLPHKRRGSKQEGGIDGSATLPRRSQQRMGEADPGVISEGESEDDFTFDDLSHKSSGSSLNIGNTTNTPVTGSLENLAGGEFLRRNYGTPPAKPPRNSTTMPPPKPLDEWEEKLTKRRDYFTAPSETPKWKPWESKAEDEGTDVDLSGSRYSSYSEHEKIVEETEEPQVQINREEQWKERDDEEIAVDLRAEETAQQFALDRERDNKAKEAEETAQRLASEREREIREQKMKDLQQKEKDEREKQKRQKEEEELARQRKEEQWKQEREQEKAKLEKEKKERELEKAKLEKEKKERELENAKLEKEKLEQEQSELERLRKEKQEREQSELERLRKEREKAIKEREREVERKRFEDEERQRMLQLELETKRREDEMREREWLKTLEDQKIKEQEKEKQAALQREKRESVVEKEDGKEKHRHRDYITKKFKNFKISTTKHPELNFEGKSSDERIIEGGETEAFRGSSKGRVPPEVLMKFEGKSRDDLIEMICDLQSGALKEKQKMKDLEDYLDNLLVRVMETTPRILQNPYINGKGFGKISG